MKRVTIVGGGLSGLSLGIALRKREVPVRIYEAGKYPRHRVCGEFINGVSRETLEELGIAEVLESSRRHRTTQWWHGGRELCQLELEQAALGVSRYVLDEKLADLFVSLVGELETGRRMSRSREEGIVWAAGRKPDRGSEWLGLKVHVQGLEMGADLEMHLGSSAYVGLAPIEQGRVNVCGLFRKGQARGSGVNLLWEYLEANGLGALRSRLQGVEVVDGSFIGVSAFHLGAQDVAEDECVLGDAESMIPPFTGNGMSMAFEAAESAIVPLESYAAGGANWQSTIVELRGRLKERFRRRLTTARVIHPLLFSDFGKLLLSASASAGVFPFRSLSRLLR